MRKTKEILILFVIMVFGIIIPVKAEGTSFKSEASSSKSSIKAGETVNVSISVKDIDMGENGINTLEGIISYDKDLFEEVKSSDIKSVNNWSVTYNDEGSTLDGKFLAVTFGQGLKEDSQIFTITFKSKNDIEKTVNTKIEFENLTSNDGSNLVNSGTKSVDIKIEGTEGNGNNVDNNVVSGNNISDDTNNKNNENKTNGNTVVNTVKNTNTVKQTGDNTKSKSGLPKTGRTSSIVILITVMVILLVCLSIKIKNMRGI